MEKDTWVIYVTLANFLEILYIYYLFFKNIYFESYLVCYYSIFHKKVRVVRLGVTAVNPRSYHLLGYPVLLHNTLLVQHWVETAVMTLLCHSYLLLWRKFSFPITVRAIKIMHFSEINVLPNPVWISLIDIWRKFYNNLLHFYLFSCILYHILIRANSTLNY